MCSDGYRGEVRAVVLEPGTGTVTHLVVEPEGRTGLARQQVRDLPGADPDPGAIVQG
jgi:hypothetical protein